MLAPMTMAVRGLAEAHHQPCRLDQINKVIDKAKP